MTFSLKQYLTELDKMDMKQNHLHGNNAKSKVLHTSKVNLVGCSYKSEGGKR